MWLGATRVSITSSGARACVSTLAAELLVVHALVVLGRRGRLGRIGFRLPCGGADGVRVRELHVRDDLPEVARDLRRDRPLEHREERAERLDREPRLVEVAALGRELVVAERGDG